MRMAGSLDKRARLWDLSSGVSISCSSKHGGTVRCVAVDDLMLVTGSADKRVRVWLSAAGDDEGFAPSSAAAKVPLFDLARRPHLEFLDHTGPVSSLCLTDRALYSGSW